MAACGIPMLALLLLVSAATPGLSAVEEGSLDHAAGAFTIAMREVSQALECFSATVQEGLRQQRESSDALKDLHTLPATVLLVQEGINQHGGKIEALKEKIEDIGKVKELTQEIEDLKNQLLKKNQSIEDLQDNHERETNELEQSSNKVAELQILLETKTSENERNVDEVRDMSRKLDESRRYAEKLEQLVRQLNNTLESKKKDVPESAEQPPQKIRTLVLQFSGSGDWSRLKKGLEDELDHSSEAYGELEKIPDDTVEPLWEMGYRGYTQLITLLLSSGLPVNTTDRDDISLLYGAARGGHYHLVKMLLSRGADVNARSSYGDTPLTMAAPKGHLEVVKLLVQAGADTTATDRVGRNALHWATVYSQTAVQEYLEQFPV